MTQTLPIWLDALAARHGRQAALMFGGTTRNFDQMSDRSHKIAAELQRRGVRHGDTVAVWLLNEPDWLAVFFACARIGAIVIAVNTRFRTTELADMIERTRPKAVFYQPQLGKVDFSALIDEALALAAGPAVLQVVTEACPGPEHSTETVVLEEFLSGSALPDAVDLTPDDGAIMFATSGTTSAPKFVLHSHRSIVDHAEDVAADFCMSDADSVMLQALPYCGVFGFCQAMAALAAGRPSIVMNMFNAAEAAQLIAAQRVTHFNATDEMLTAIAEGSSAGMRKSLRLIGAASFNRGPETLAALARDDGMPIVGLYGMSEVQALYARRDLADPPATRFQGGGRPVSQRATVRVRDPETGKICTGGESGELELRGPSLLKIYFGDANATSAAMTEDGFVKTGDLGYLDADGGFTFESRMGDALRLGGFLVNPDEISGFIESIDGVQSCVVVGVRFEGRLRAAAFVKIWPKSDIELTLIKSRCKEDLAPFKVPALVHAVDEFPVADGPNGVKVQRGALRRFASELLEQ